MINALKKDFARDCNIWIIAQLIFHVHAEIELGGTARVFGFPTQHTSAPRHFNLGLAGLVLDPTASTESIASRWSSCLEHVCDEIRRSECHNN